MSFSIRVLMIVCLGVTVINGGDWLDDAVTYYRKEYTPRLKEYDTDLKRLRIIKQNPVDAAKYEQFVKESSYYQPREMEFRRKHGRFSEREVGRFVNGWLIPGPKRTKEQAIQERAEFDAMLKEWDKERALHAETTQKNYLAVPYEVRENLEQAVPENVRRRMRGEDEPFTPEDLDIRANVARKVNLNRPTWAKFKQGAREGYGRFTNYIKSFYSR